MKRWFIACALAAAALSLLAAQAKGKAVSCLVLVAEGVSSEGNALFLRNMALDPAALRRFSPSAFAFAGGRIQVEAEGAFGYSASTPRLLERRGATALYQVEAEIRAPALPKAWKTAVVEMRTAELAAGADLGLWAIELAARKLKLAKGRAWIERMELKSPGLIRVKVAFAR